MTAKPRCTRGNLWKIWPAPTALLTTMLLVLALVDRSSSADDSAAPTPEETARYLEWYRHQRLQNATGTDVSPDDVVRFREWYKHNGAPVPAATPADKPKEASPEEVARYVEWYKHTTTPIPPPVEVVRLLEWYQHNGAPTPVAAVASAPPTPSSEATLAHEADPHRQASPEPAPDSVARFVDWYKHEGAPQAADRPAPPPTRDDVVRFLEWYKHHGAPATVASEEAVLTSSDVTRYLEAYKHSGAPMPIAQAPRSEPPPAPVSPTSFAETYLHNNKPGTSPMPVITPVDVHPIEDHSVQTVAAQETPRPLVVSPPPPLKEVEAQPTLAIVPPPPLVPLVSAKDAPTSVPVVLAKDAPTGGQLPPLPPLASAAPAPLPPLTAPPTVQPPTALVPEQAPVTPFDSVLEQVGCTSCGTGGGVLGFHAPVSGVPVTDLNDPNTGGCGCANCIPGRLNPGSTCEADTVLGRFLCELYQCICCPDPCYDPKWIPLADAAFFVESARPQTQQSIGWDAGRNLTAPDIAEYFWARADGKGSGPNPANHANPNGVLGETLVNYNTLWLYTEAALGNIGVFAYVPYLSEDGELTGHAAGFSDMQFGTKTLLFDCELLQIAFEFRIFAPVGDAPHALGTGHVSLEPGLIVGLKVAQDTYFQGEIQEWIPLGGDPDYEGALLEYHLSLNHVLYRILPDVPLVGTAELNGWSFQTGQFTNPQTGPQSAAGITYISVGPGLRLFVCDKIDFGVGTAFAVTGEHFADQLFRTEFRWRF